MFRHQFGEWTLLFDEDYRLIMNDKNAVVVDNERHVIVLMSLSDTGNFLIEKTYYAMTYEIHLEGKVIEFHTVDD